MTIQRLRTFLPPLPGQRTASRSITSLTLLLLVVMGLPALSGAQICQPDGDVDRNGSVTAADALLAFQQALGLAQLTACQQTIANVFPQPNAPDASITASDALCIFQKALSLPSCLDTLPSANLPPIVDAGPDQSVEAGVVVVLSGTARDPDGTIASYEWTQTGGATLSFTGADAATAVFVAPDVNATETLIFRLTVRDDAGAQASDEVRVTVQSLEQAVEEQLQQLIAEIAEAVFIEDISGPIVQAKCVNCHVAGGLSGHTRLVLVRSSDAANHEARNLQVFKDFLAAVADEGGGSLILNKIQGVGHGGGVQVSPGSVEFANMRRFLSLLGGQIPPPPNELPVANAGPDQTVDENTPVTLSGSGSDPDGTIAYYEWIQVSGTTVTISGAYAQTATFTAPDVDSDEDLVFQLTVTDDGGASDTDMVTVTVRAAQVSALREMVFENPGPGQPGYVIAGDNASLQYWFTPSGDVSQALYEKADGTERVRTFYDEVTGAPRTVLNEISGHWLSVREAGPDRVDFWTYDSAGNYLNGFAIYEISGQYYTGEVIGVPAHEWEPITGEVTATGASLTGNFVLTGHVEDGLTNIREAPTELVALIDELATDEANNPSAIRPASGGLSHHSVMVADAVPYQADEDDGERKKNNITLAGLIGVGGGTQEKDTASSGFIASLYKRFVEPKDASAPPNRGKGCTERGRCARFPVTVTEHLAEQDTQGSESWGGKLMNCIVTSGCLSRLINRAKETLTGITDGLSSTDKTGLSAATESTSLIVPATVRGRFIGFATWADGSKTQLEGTITESGDFWAEGDRGGTPLYVSGRKAGDGTFDVSVCDLGTLGTETYSRCTVKVTSGPLPPSHREPIAQAIPDQMGTVGETLTLNLSTYFSHPDGVALTYEVSCSVHTQTSQPNVEVRQSEAQALFTPTSAGVAICTARAYPIDRESLFVSSIFRLIVSSQPDPVNPGNPGDGGSHSGRCISGNSVQHTLFDGHVASGHQITNITPAPSVAGLTSGYHGNTNSNGEWQGRVLGIFGSSVEVRWYDNGTLLESCKYNSRTGKPYAYFTTYVNGEADGVQYAFFRSDGGWTFRTYRAGILHGPYGGYDGQGQKYGCFGSHTNGNRDPGEVCQY